MAERKPAKKGARQPAKRTTGKASKGFTAEERAAMRERAEELKAETRRGPRAGKADGETDVLAKIEAACDTAGHDERFQKAVRQATQEPVYRSSAEFAKVLAADSDVKRDVIKRAGIKAP